MQDRFKFRCFNKFQDKMFDVKLMSYVDGIVKRIEVQDDESILIFDDYNNSIDNLILMQCTGLKDKNGKLIYEGDILKENWHIYKLEWGNGAYTIKDIKRGTSYMFTSGMYIEKSEVIGNIYENEELLNDRK